MRAPGYLHREVGKSPPGRAAVVYSVSGEHFVMEQERGAPRCCTGGSSVFGLLFLAVLRLCRQPSNGFVFVFFGPETRADPTLQRIASSRHPVVRPLQTHGRTHHTTRAPSGSVPLSYRLPRRPPIPITRRGSSDCSWIVRWQVAVELVGTPQAYASSLQLTASALDALWTDIWRLQSAASGQRRSTSTRMPR